MEYDPINDESQPLTPRAAWYLVALFITIIGPTLALHGLYKSIQQPFTKTIELSETASEISIDTPGHYTFYVRPSFSGDFLTKTQEIFQSAEQHIHQFAVLDGSSQPVNVHQFEFYPWVSLNDGKPELMIGRASVTIPKAGTYMITQIKPLDSTSFLAQPSPKILYKTAIHHLSLLIVSMILGPLMLMVIFFLRLSNQRLQANTDYQSAGYKRTVKDIRLFATTVHLGGLFGYVFPAGHLLVPILVYSVTHQKNVLMRANLYAVMNFQISMSLYVFLSILMIFLTGAFVGALAPIFVIITLLLILIHIVLTIIGVIMSFKDGLFLYPLSMNFLQTSHLI